MRYMKAFKRAQKLAAAVAKDPAAIKLLADQAHAKVVGSEGRFKGLKKDFEAMLRLCRAWALGKYKNVGFSTIITVIAAVIYFVNPFDVIPDFTPILGLTDDLTVIGFTLTRLRKELEKFHDWENEVTLE